PLCSTRAHSIPQGQQRFRDLCHAGLPAVTASTWAAEEVVRRVYGHPMKPDLEGRGLPQFLQAEIQAGKHFLGYIFRVFRTPDHSANGGDDLAPVREHDAIESRGIPRLGALQLFRSYPHGSHSATRRGASRSKLQLSRVWALLPCRRTIDNIMLLSPAWGIRLLAN